MRLRTLFRRNLLDQELDEELRDYLERRTEHEIAKGSTPEQARRVAVRAMGGVEQRKEQCRDTRGTQFADQLFQDLRYARRTLTRAPGFCTVCIALLAVGIGANATIFSLINAFLFRPIALEEPDRLAGIYNGHRTNPDDWRGFDGARYQTVRQNATSFADVLAHRFTPVGLSEATLTRPAFAEFVSTNYFSVLGIRPYRGRGLSDGEDAAPIAIASYAYWARTGFDPALIGTTVRVNRTGMIMAGVIPEGFTGLTAMLSPDLWLPIDLLDERASGQIGPRGPGQNATLLLVGQLQSAASPSRPRTRNWNCCSPFGR